MVATGFSHSEDGSFGILNTISVDPATGIKKKDQKRKKRKKSFCLHHTGAHTQIAENFYYSGWSYVFGGVEMEKGANR